MHLNEWEADLALTDDNMDYTLGMNRFEEDKDRVCSCKEEPLFVEFLSACWRIMTQRQKTNINLYDNSRPLDKLFGQTNI